ncbi:MAG TPA: PAS domain-containing protein, partial [Leptolinea sp.]
MINSTPLIAMEQVIGKTDFDLLSSEEANRFQTIKKDLLINGQCHYEEIPFTQNNTVQYFSLFFQAWCDDNEEIIGITTYLHDITKQKDIEIELKQQLEGETLLAELSSQFILAENIQIDEQINKALQKMANYLHADLGFI